ncbi:MAG: tyrosine-type recombinase/integrase, partial [Candidatus Sulfotelmatobacter sp.]
MFDQLLSRKFHILRHQSGPYSEERQRYLSFLIQEGRSRSTLQAICGLLYSIAQLIPLDVSVTIPQIEAAADEYGRPRHCSQRSRHVVKRWFVYHATKWLRLLGRLREPVAKQAFGLELEAFLTFEIRERGLAPETILNRRRSLSVFLTWLATKVESLAEVTPDHIACYFTTVGVQRRWKRTTISFVVNQLRQFFRFAESKGWCRSRLAATIDAPRMYGLERLPRGPAWADVQRLIRASRGNDPSNIRDHAILLLLAVYGFRSGEVRLLRLDELDWERETVHVRRPKQRKSQRYPLVREVGDAILHYLRKVRPQSRHPEVFLTLKHPHQPLSGGGFGTMVRKRMRRLGLKLHSYGPHTLRHACATHLLSEGFSLAGCGKTRFTASMQRHYWIRLRPECMTYPKLSCACILRAGSW